VKVVIDPDACTGHGRCYTVAPSVFAADESGFGSVTAAGPLDDGQLAEARAAVANCPERAITLIGSDGA